MFVPARIFERDIQILQKICDETYVYIALGAERAVLAVRNGLSAEREPGDPALSRGRVYFVGYGIDSYFDNAHSYIRTQKLEYAVGRNRERVLARF